MSRIGYRDDNGQRRYVMTVTVCDHGQYDGGPFEFGESYTDGSLNRVVESLLKIREMVPAEYRDKARCEISAYTSYDSSSASIQVQYERPATQEEADAEMAREQAHAKHAADKERAEFERLSKKFSNASSE